MRHVRPSDKFNMASVLGRGMKCVYFGRLTCSNLSFRIGCGCPGCSSCGLKLSKLRWFSVLTKEAIRCFLFQVGRVFKVQLSWVLCPYSQYWKFVSSMRGVCIFLMDTLGQISTEKSCGLLSK
uniref:Uncharacterized protein n=1 Tax=Cacopsylla melanoneura TaxID=428564 RepID=A0A8D9ECQ5_9HEMI